MGDPVTVNIPHQIGLAEAKNRIGSGIHTLGEIIPGATLSDHHWQGDHMHCTIDALGQRIKCEMQVREDEVYGIFDLPPHACLVREQDQGKASERSA